MIFAHALGTVTDDLSLALNGEVLDRCVFTVSKQTVIQIICFEVCNIPVKVEMIDRMTVAFKSTAEAVSAVGRCDRLPIKAFKVNIIYKLKFRRRIGIVKGCVGMVSSGERGDPEQIAGILYLIEAVRSLIRGFIVTAVAANAVNVVVIDGHRQNNIPGDHREPDFFRLGVIGERNQFGNIPAIAVGNSDGRGENIVVGDGKHNGLALGEGGLVDREEFAFAVGEEQFALLIGAVLNGNAVF